MSENLIQNLHYPTLCGSLGWSDDGKLQFSYIIYRDMQIIIRVQRDTLVIALQSNFQVHTVNYGVVWPGRLIPSEIPRVGHPYYGLSSFGQLILLQEAKCECEKRRCGTP